MATFMKYEGIEGESQVRGKSGFIELLSFAWGTSRAVQAASGQARGDAEVSVQEVVLTKQQDRTSAQLFSECTNGKFDRTVEIDFITTGANNKPTSFLKLKLQNCGISSFSISGGGGDGRPTEALTLNFQKVTMESFDMNDARNAVPFTAGFDVAAGKAT